MPLLQTPPEWAINNPTDPISGIDAIVVPSVAKRNSGFLRLERPPRQDFNWAQNQNGLWFKYMKGFFKDVINGFRILEYIGSPPTAIRFSKGFCFDSTGNFLFDSEGIEGGNFISTGLTKDISTSFIEGDSNGGLASGLTLTSNTWYHAFIIYIPSSGRIDIGFDTDIQANNLVTLNGATYYRRISSHHYVGGGTGLEPMLQVGNKFIYRQLGKQSTNLKITITSGPTGTSTNDLVPPQVSTIATLVGNVYLASGASSAKRAIVYGDNYSGVNGPGSQFFMLPVPNLINEGTPNTFEIFQNGIVNALNVKLDASVTTETLDINLAIMSYIDTRGNDWGAGPAEAAQQGLFYL